MEAERRRRTENNGPEAPVKASRELAVRWQRRWGEESTLSAAALMRLAKESGVERPTR